MVVAAADRVIAVSSLNREMLVSLGASSARVEIVPNGAAIEEIEAIPVENLRTELGIADDAFVIMTVGRNSPIKRMELLYEAIARVRTRIPRMWCISVGPVKDLRALAERFGIADMVVLTGAVPEKGIASEGPPFPRLVNLYRSADLFVSVSFLEAFNMSALDALACGTPVLVSEKQGIRDLIREGDTGSVLYDETPEALGERLVMLSATAAVMRANRKAVQRSVAHCTWDVAARRLAEIYREVLAERNPIRRVV
jgi:glycosyltransferase involved in cell wall biosynthesis